MLVTLSPAKKLNMDPVKGIAPTDPPFPADTMELVDVARNLTLKDLRSMMSISQDLAVTNRDRFKAFEEHPTAEQTRPAAFMFSGDTYKGLDIRTLDPNAIRWAQQRVRILSGLYGLLRPLDAIQPYRLEMGSKLKTDRGGSLYTFWGEKIADELNNAAQSLDTAAVVNCASEEYFKAVNRKALKLRIITPVFKNVKNGKAKVISFYAKQARGAMARFICENQIENPAALLEFSAGGYVYEAGESSADSPVFIRE